MGETSCRSRFSVGMLIVMVALVGCERGALRYQSDHVTPSMAAVRYDRTTGRCPEGVIQVLPQIEFDALVRSWQESDPTPSGSVCSAPGVERLPSRTDYPKGPEGRYINGAAHVLVLMDRDGSPHAVHAVCATSAAFAESAAYAARRLAYTAIQCDGRSARAVLMVPIDFSPN